MISEDEREPFNAFKESYLAHADADMSSRPCWEISPDSLAESGWRSLDDVTLLRFLRADKRKGCFNPEASMQRLLSALAWRKKMRSDELLASAASEEYEGLRVRRWMGIDHSGRPVQFERIGSFLCSGNAKAFSAETWLSHYARDLETTFAQMRAAAAARGAPVVSYLYCGDFAGGGGVAWHMSTIVPLLKYLAREVEAHFPEIVGTIVLFNAPRVFAGLFPMIRAFMDPITAAKIEVHSGVPKARLLELMPPHTLPSEYGGDNATPYPPTSRFRRAGAAP